MKVFSNDAVYVQKKDLDFLYSSDVTIPRLVFLNLFRDGEFFVCENDKNDFFKFDGEEAVSYFRKMDFIVDYNKVCDLDDAHLSSMCSNIISEIHILKNLYEKFSPSKRLESCDLITNCKLLEYKYQSLKDFILNRHNEGYINLPETSKRVYKKA